MNVNAVFLFLFWTHRLTVSALTNEANPPMHLAATKGNVAIATTLNLILLLTAQFKEKLFNHVWNYKYVVLIIVFRFIFTSES
jgi:hypothetical protein